MLHTSKTLSFFDGGKVKTHQNTDTYKHILHFNMHLPASAGDLDSEATVTLLD